MKQLDEHRSVRVFGKRSVGRGLIVKRDTKPGFFCGWTAILIANNEEAVSSYAQPTLRAALKELRFKLSKIKKLPRMSRNRGWMKRLTTGTRYFTADFSGTDDGVNRYWCRKTLTIEASGFITYKVHYEISGRNARAQWQKREKAVEFCLYGKTVAAIKTTLRELMAMVAA